ncbi:Ribokinase-like protein [Mucor mucedo]|uniref:Ribokinase-like protein n=1 Tax=Mucor mucedo TaxID=29922 RepID=UPI00221EE584|nr:Ribokinase-like protein [Mucor mucedo]KAI7885470.1 Ribokinase-like protein [Mucor mucedo]
MFISSTKSVFLFAVLCFVFIQTTYADIYSQLQFIKISSPKSGQNVVAGKQLLIKYVMQPLIKDHVSAGKALHLEVNWHKRTGNAKQKKVSTIAENCPITAKDNKYVTYTKKWPVPKNTVPGSYAVDFVEKIQLRRGQITATETVKINSFSVPHICLSGETMFSTEYYVRAGGKGANQSMAFAKAGGNIYHAGNYGNDAGWRNGRAFIQVSKETGDNCIVLYPGTNYTYTAEEAVGVFESFGPGDWLVQQNEISQGGEIMRLGATKGLSVLFNPAPLTKGILKAFDFNNVTILIVNEHEAQSLYEELGGEKKVFGLDIASELLNEFGSMQGVVVTLGGEGVVAKFRNEGKTSEFKVPSRKVAVKDTTAAGDTFVGYFLASFIRAEKEEYFKRVDIALNEANFASSIAVQRLGSMDSVPTLEEVSQAMKEQ